MFRRQRFLVLGVAIFLGLLAVYLVNAALGAAERSRAGATETTRVAVAATPLQFGTKITPERVRFVEWPADAVPPGSFSNLEQLLPSGNAQVALRAIDLGEPILKSKLSGEGGRATLSAILPEGKRAVSIRVTDVAGVSGFVLPGDRVDIIVIRAVANSGSQVADLLLEGVRVLAIDQESSDGRDQPLVGKTATLEVTPFEAQKLALAQQVGQLSLALRSVKAIQEGGTSYSQGVKSSDLGGTGYVIRNPGAVNPSAVRTGVHRRRVDQSRRTAGQSRPPPPRESPAPEGSNVQVVRGTASSNYEVKRYGG